MDVSFTNVLEGARQYFQGLPAGTGSSASPSYPVHPEGHHLAKEPGQQQIQQNPPTSSGYWPNAQQHEIQRPPTRELTPNQRPSSHQSDTSTSRPPSHHSQVGYSPTPSHDARIQQHNSSQGSYQDQFQFHMPHSRDTPSSHQYQSHIVPNSIYQQQPASPQQQQQPRVPSRSTEQMPITPTPSSPHTYHQLQTSQNYQNYQQNRSFYPVQSQMKPQTSQLGSLYKMNSQSYPITTKENPYYKNVNMAGVLHSQNSSQVPGTHVNSNQTAASSFQNTPGPAPGHGQTNNFQEGKLEQNSTVNQTQVSSHGYKATHNLPPIAAISSINYHSNRSGRDVQRQGTSRIRTTSSSYSPSTSASTNQPVINTSSQMNHARTSHSSSLGQSNAIPISDSYPNSNTQHDYRTSVMYSNQSRTLPNQNYPYATTTQSYNRVVTTSSISPYNVPIQTQSSAPQYYHQNEIQHTQQQSQKSHPISAVQPPQNNNSQQVISHVDLTGSSPLLAKQKRESPLDLSVKTVRTPADSTRDDMEQEARLKSQSALRQKQLAVQSHNYPTYDVGLFQRKLSQKSMPTATAPKVDFLPDFSLTQSSASANVQRPDIRRTEVPAMVDNKNNINQKLGYNKMGVHSLGQQQYPQNRFLNMPIPSNTHHSSNAYLQTQQPMKQNVPRESLPRIDFPSQAHKTSSIYSAPVPEQQKKRQADPAPSMIPNKIPKIDNWKQTIDQEIEQRFSTYKQQQEQKNLLQNKSTPVNGFIPRTNEKSQKEFYNSYQRPEHHGMPPHQLYTNTSQYQSKTNHSQTYVPSVSNHHYPPYGSYPAQQQPNMHLVQSHLPRANSNSSLHSLSLSPKTNSGGAANKHVINLLRNSLEIKEAQKQLKNQQLDHLRSDIPHPSTDVTAPLQPKPIFTGRQNVSPFTPTNLPESHYNTTPYKLHLPKAIDSVNFETDSKHNLGDKLDKQMIVDEKVILASQNTPSSDLDGLAAFLAARIRTKAELKQVGSIQAAYNNTSNNNDNSQLHNIIENQLKTPIKEELPSNESAVASVSSNSSNGVSPPKLMKENQVFSPRRRLFSRTEDDFGTNVPKVPPRDKSGLRSSSEASVFDFPDSDSEGEMPILERQSLEDMRRDRKSVSKPSSIVEVKIEPDKPPSPTDAIFDQTCSSFIEELKTGVGKKRGRRKKCIDPDALVTLEKQVTKEKPAEEIKIKTEIDDYDQINPVISIKEEVTEVPEAPEAVVTNDTDTAVEDEDSDVPLIKIKENDRAKEKEKLTKSSITPPNSSSKKMISPKKEKLRVLKKSFDLESNMDKELMIKIEPQEIDITDRSLLKCDEKATATGLEDVKQGTVPSLDLAIIVRPAKKPTFGDGSDFYPGWEEEVCRYKKSLRMPPSLIQANRPPHYHRLSTSLPDLDPCPYSPAENTDYSKTKLKKMKSEPLDSDTESNSSFNVFTNKSNYDSEGSCSVKSLPGSKEGKESILDTLLERYGARKKRKHKKKEDGPKIIPKSQSDLLPTPSLEIDTKKSSDSKKAEPVIKSESILLGFRKKTMDTFKETFMTQAKKIVGVNNEHLTTVVLNSRTRKQTRVLKQRATIKEVFGEDRPASAPPVCVNDVKIKQEIEEETVTDEEKIKSDCHVKLINDSSADAKLVLKNKILDKNRKRSSNLLKTLVDKKIKAELKDEQDEDREETISIKQDPDCKSETPSIDGDEGSNSGKKRSKIRNIRRKFSSGFDYIRKKKRQIKKDLDTDTAVKYKKRSTSVKSNPESIQDIQKEIKTWVLNKGIGETHLHRAARLGYTDVTVYCLEKMNCIPSPKDNAGYTPLHEACARGHLDIAKILLAYGANASESAQGGIRPLHEAVENGFIEIIRLLLSYGADPMLATYGGLTPLKLASDEVTAELLKNHLADTKGEERVPWFMYGPASCFDLKETGYNVLDDTPEADPASEEEDVEFEVTETILPNLYMLQKEPPTDRWVLLQDLSNLLKIKSRDALLRQLSDSQSPSTSSSSSVNNRSVLRELKMSDFLEQAHCCQFLNAGEKINTRASKIALVKYTDKVRELLNVEKVAITR